MFLTLTKGIKATNLPANVCSESVVAFCTLRFGEVRSVELTNALKTEVRQRVGALATPDFVVYTGRLPKTKSGKTMRRLLRRIAVGQTKPEQLGDLSSLTDISVVPELIEAFKNCTAAI